MPIVHDYGDVFPHADERALARFIAKIRVNGECWEWTGAINKDGYGFFWLKPKQFYAHRAAIVLSLGAVPESHEVHHKCDNPACVNPSHLEVLSQRKHSEITPTNYININGHKAHCPKGHPYTHVWGGRRVCRTCRLAQKHAYRQRRGNSYR